MIETSSKILFIHVPKCGGTYLEKGIAPEIVLPEGEVHLSLEQSVDRYGHEQVSDCFRFSVARNPFSRLVSAYLDYRRRKFRPLRPTIWLPEKLLRHAYKPIFLSNFGVFLECVCENRHLYD